MKKELPLEFIERTRALLGDEYPAFEAALAAEPPVSIRLNPRKKTPDWLAPLLEANASDQTSVYLPSRPVFTLDPLFHAGCYYVQEASSMFLEYYIKKYISNPVSALDLCAAPGGKANHLASLLPEGSLLTANETIRSRVGVLMENLIKWGYSNVLITNNDPTKFGGNSDSYDLILCDLPCSGEGMFRKDPKAISEWSVDNVKLCAERQRRIVADVFPALKAGGLLIYSTCTYNREENEENLEWICGKLGADILETPHRFYPHRNKGEGFFIAGLRKHGSSTDEMYGNQKSKTNSGNNLNVVFDGRKVSFDAAKDQAPQHAASMSIELPENAFPRWDLDLETALNYLRREALRDIPTNIPKGYVIVTYQHQPLGFVKNIGARANNLYPQEWRIRMR